MALAHRGHPPERLEDRRVGRIGIVTRAQPEFLTCLVVLPDRAAGGAGELVGAGHDGLQHRLEIERGAEDAPDVTQCCQFVHRTGQLGGARLQLGQQPRVFDGDHRLIRECLN